MDFEERLEEAEQLDAPSLVGSSLRSADDSAHNNYIHPEKYNSTSKAPSTKFSQTISASLDDLINEGALLASEEDFDDVLDTDGTVKPDIKFEPIEEKLGEENDDEEENIKEVETPKVKEVEIESKPEEPVEIPTSSVSTSSVGASEVVESTSANKDSSFYGQENYSTPNLSEYQLANEIKDHSQLLENVQSYDHYKLPRSESGSAREPASPVVKKSIITPQAVPQRHEGLVASSREGIHSPFFHTDRPRSRSRSSNPGSRSGNRSSSRSSSTQPLKPHLARGDSYKNTNVDEPSKYELPPDLALQKQKEEAEDSESVSVRNYEGEEEEEEEDRRTRYSRPTMGESIAAAEAAAAALKAESTTFKENAPISTQFGMGNYDEKPITRDPSLVTTGDYTNFEVDTPRNPLPPTTNLYGARSASSTNYLRSISRSRSRARNGDVGHNSSFDDKNDADPQQLQREGALISDDPYASIQELDTMVEEVLQGKSVGGDETEEESKKEILDKVSNVGLNDEKEVKETADETKKDENEGAEQETSEVAKAESEVVEPAEPEEEAKVEKDNDEKDEEVVEQAESEEETKEEEGEVVEQAERKPEEETKEKIEEEEVAKDAEEETSEEKVEEEEAAKPDELKEEVVVIDHTEASEQPDENATKEVKKDVEPIVEPTSTKPEDDDDFADLEISPEEIRKHLESLPIYLYTSLAGGMQIMPRTNRLVTILNANGIKFEYRDLGTDEEAKKIWKRQAGGKTLPGIVRGDDFIGNWHDIDEANEEYKLQELLYETL
ncbi:Uncharacterized protein JA1_000020 [Spathaspora sp. JA1]|nr:Uncharacterized protein JA1_000020 [Spathaspora sp. JA1]